MAHFAQLDENNVVVNVVVIANKDTADESGEEKEYIGVAYCERLFGGRWVQTSYNRTFRKHFAGIGSTYDEQRDAFIPPKPFPSWVLNEDTCLWDPPIPKMPPDENVEHAWDEATLSWVVVPQE